MSKIESFKDREMTLFEISCLFGEVHGVEFSFINNPGVKYDFGWFMGRVGCYTAETPCICSYDSVLKMVSVKLKSEK